MHTHQYSLTHSLTQACTYKHNHPLVWNYTSLSVIRLPLVSLTDYSPSPSMVHLVFFEHLHFIFNDTLLVHDTLWTLTLHLQWYTSCACYSLNTYTSSSMIHFLYTILSEHLHFIFNDTLLVHATLWTLTFHLQWYTSCTRYSLNTYISSSMIHFLCMLLSEHLHFIFNGTLLVHDTLWTLTFHLQWYTSCACYSLNTYTSSSMIHFLYTILSEHLHFIFNDTLLVHDTLWTLTLHLQWYTSCTRYSLNTYTSFSMVHFLCMILSEHLHFIFNDTLLVHDTLWTLTLHLQWYTSCTRYSLNTYTSSSMIHFLCTILSEHLLFIFNDILLVHDTLWTLTLHLQWYTSCTRYSLNTYTSSSMIHFLCTILSEHLLFIFNDILLVHDTLWTLTLHLQWYTSCTRYSLNTYTSSSMIHFLCTILSEHLHFIFNGTLLVHDTLWTLTLHLQWYTSCTRYSLNTYTSSSMIHFLCMLLSEHLHFIFNDTLLVHDTLWTLTLHLQWYTSCACYSLNTYTSSSMIHFLYTILSEHLHFIFNDTLLVHATLWTLTLHLNTRLLVHNSPQILTLGPQWYTSRMQCCLREGISRLGAEWRSWWVRWQSCGTGPGRDLAAQAWGSDQSRWPDCTGPSCSHHCTLTNCSTHSTIRVMQMS